MLVNLLIRYLPNIVAILYYSSTERRTINPGSSIPHTWSYGHLFKNQHSIGY